MDMTQLAPNLFASAQIDEPALLVLARNGFTDVVCNRPDAEHPETAQSPDMIAAAQELGLVFHYLPITPGGPFVAEAEALGQVVARPGAMVLAYCRSGARVSSAWALALTKQNAGHA